MNKPAFGEPAALVELVPGPAWRCDRTGLAHEFNTAFLALLGYPGEALRGDRWYALLPKEERGGLAARLCAGADARQSLDLRLRAADGNWRALRAHAANHGDDILLAAVDIGELHQERNDLELLLDQVPALILLRDGAGNIRRANRRGHEFLGAAPGALTGRNLRQLRPREAERWIAEERRVLESGQSLHTPKIGVTGEDGEHRWWRTDKVPYRDADGRVTGVVVMVQDITGYTEIEDELRRQRGEMQTILDNIPVNILFKDGQDNILRANRAAAAALGRRVEELVNIPTTEIFPDPERRYWREDLAVMRDGRPILARELEITTSDGAAQWVRYDKVPYFGDDGYARGVILFWTEITAEVRARQQVEQAIEQLTLSNRELERFAHVAAHDLKEPLRMVSSYTELLAEDYGASLDDQALKYLTFAREGAERMRRLVEDLLEYARMGRREAPERFSADRALDFALANLARLIEERQASVVRDHLPEIQGSPVRLTRLFQNLVHNAIKYAHEDRPPRIEIAVQRDGAMCRFSIADNGIGIDPAHGETIFEPFRRLHGRLAYPGSGIGLAICRRIVESAGGRIWVEPGESCGSRFLFTLPRDPLPATGLPPPGGEFQI